MAHCSACARTRKLLGPGPSFFGLASTHFVPRALVTIINFFGFQKDTFAPHYSSGAELHSTPLDGP